MREEGASYIYTPIKLKEHRMLMRCLKRNKEIREIRMGENAESERARESTHAVSERAPVS